MKTLLLLGCLAGAFFARSEISQSTLFGDVDGESVTLGQILDLKTGMPGEGLVFDGENVRTYDGTITNINAGSVSFRDGNVDEFFGGFIDALAENFGSVPLFTSYNGARPAVAADVGALPDSGGTISGTLRFGGEGIPNSTNSMTKQSIVVGESNLCIVSWSYSQWEPSRTNTLPQYLDRSVRGYVDHGNEWFVSEVKSVAVSRDDSGYISATNAAMSAVSTNGNGTILGSVGAEGVFSVLGKRTVVEMQETVQTGGGQVTLSLDDPDGSVEMRMYMNGYTGDLNDVLDLTYVPMDPPMYVLSFKDPFGSGTCLYGMDGSYEFGTVLSGEDWSGGLVFTGNDWEHDRSITITASRQGGQTTTVTNSQVVETAPEVRIGDMNVRETIMANASEVTNLLSTVDATSISSSAGSVADLAKGYTLSNTAARNTVVYSAVNSAVNGSYSFALPTGINGKCTDWVVYLLSNTTNSLDFSAFNGKSLWMEDASATNSVLGKADTSMITAFYFTQISTNIYAVSRQELKEVR